MHLNLDNGTVIVDELDFKKVEKLIRDGLQIDGGHHKQWALQEIAKALNIYTDNIDFTEGIAP